MKWYPNQLQTAIKQGNLPNVTLIYGEDGGMVSQLAKAATEATGIDPTDPFSSTKLSAEELAREPERLMEAATTISFGGGKQLIRLDGINTSLTVPELKTVSEAIKSTIEDADLTDVFLIISATALEATSALAKAITSSKTAAAVRCFHDSERDLATTLRNFFQAKNKRLEPAAQEFLTNNLGNDRAVTTSELEKLDLYTAERDLITLEDCLNTIANAPSVGVFKLCDAIGSRNRKDADSLIQALLQEGEDMHFVSTMVQRHLKRIHDCQSLMSQGHSPDSAMNALRPPVKVGRDLFVRQVRTYPAKRLKTISHRFLELQTQSRQGHIPPEHLTARTLLALAS